MTAALTLDLSWPPQRTLAAETVADTRLLADIAFGLPPAPNNSPGTLHVAAPPLDPAHSSHMVWLVDSVVRTGQRGALTYRQTDDWLSGVLVMDEAAFAAHDGVTPLQGASCAAYRALFETLDALGYPGLLRVWTYLPAINAIEYGSERYRQFNAGRQKAFIDCGRALDRDMSAACVLGVTDGPPLLAFLAGRTRPQGVENPRQISAWRYPEQYGARRPLFSRAAFMRCGAPGHDSIVLFVSGTASIVGHATCHAGDVAAQTRETLANIEAVLEEAGRIAGVRFPPETFAYVAYIRRRADLPLVRDIVRARLGAASVIYVQADVCRADLLVEIEASGGHGIAIRHPSAAG